MMLALALSAALAVQPVQPAEPVASSDFDLTPPAAQTQHEERPMQLVPERPRNLDTRDFNAPEAEWKVADGGPLLMVGAMGGRRSGMPKLAHVALDWSF